ncbi:FtsX-like permease family protein [Aureibaculum sp. 2210JD6-5]|uniref:ABC transporter permease n=1 Tax=Aureibaculum sp. 2210JD6-5 TaxID=3103957 RepID=UPI002AAE8B54|nr:FtsX-like permease family protein [Aureibaculum sp. 2210JD6-5]MDY7396153.1 FtsX-like permease family protein [Aureibaculum sp. 2210JD6-5]
MNYELFLAKRIITGKQYKSSISSSIIKIAITAIALGLIIMLISIATTAGLQKKIKEKISGFNGHIQISNYEDNNSQITISPISINQEFYPDIENVEGIKNVQSFATKAGVIRTETDFEGVIYKGVNTDFDWSFFKTYLVEGNVIDIDDKTTDKVLISKYTSDRLKLKLGNKFNMFFMKDDGSAPNVRSFKVIGIYNSGYKEFDENYVIGDLKHVQRLNKWEADQIGGFEVILNDFDQLEEKGTEVYNQVGSTLNAQTIAEKYAPIFEWLDLLNTNIVVIIVIMILIAGINMITALLVLILERTQMIGILKSLGSSNWSIRKVFLYNAAYLIAKGLLWGNIIGIGLLMAQKYFGFIKLDPENYYVSEAPVHISLSAVVILNIGTLLLCLLMLLVPSYIVSKISPVKAIKFD